MDLINQAVSDLNKAVFIFNLSAAEIQARKIEVVRLLDLHNHKRPLSIRLVFKARTKKSYNTIKTAKLLRSGF